MRPIVGKIKDLLDQLDDEMGVPDGTWYTTEEAARMLGRKPVTLRAWRHQKKGPAYIRRGNLVLYRYQDIVDYRR